MTHPENCQGGVCLEVWGLDLGVLDFAPNIISLYACRPSTHCFAEQGSSVPEATSLFPIPWSRFDDSMKD